MKAILIAAVLIGLATPARAGEIPAGSKANDNATVAVEGIRVTNDQGGTVTTVTTPGGTVTVDKPAHEPATVTR